MGYSKYQLGTINLLYSTPKICHITPLPPPAHRPPLHNDRFLLSPRWPFWRGSTVYPFSARHHMSFQLQSKLCLRPALVTTTYVKPPFELWLRLCNKKLYYSRSSPCDHSRKRPALVTTTYVKPPFELWLRLCNKKLYYSRSSPSDHSRKRPALVTTTYVKPPFELWLRLCNKKLS